MSKKYKRKSLTPIFIFSLPRSGSTLLQRMLAAHPEICTVSEPWLLLPLFYASRERGIYAEYMHSGVAKGMANFFQHLPNHEADYFSAIRKMALILYRKVSSDNAIFFVDKTPRYSLIASQITQAFPDAKFVFLWRNPLDIVSSILESWSPNGKWNLYHYTVDLFQGLENLISAWKANEAQAISLRYEDLVNDPVSQMKHICQYLVIDYDSSVVDHFSEIGIEGLGDKVGSKKYMKQISDASCDKWPSSVCNPLRRYWFGSYLHWIGDSRMREIGYDFDLLKTQLRESQYQSTKLLVSDIWRMSYGALMRFIPLKPIRDNYDCWRSGGTNVKLN